LTGRFRERRVGVLFGGPSKEREVSLETGRGIQAALLKRGYQAILIDALQDLPGRLRAEGVEVVYNALHGTLGEDGRVQGLLDWMGLPYTGEDWRSSLLAFDKGLAKDRFRAVGLPVAEDLLLTPAEALALKASPMALPLVAKPVSEGSSVGVSLIKRPEELRPALKRAAACGPVLLERFVQGQEISVVVMEAQILGSVEIEPLRKFYDYSAKYKETGTRYHLPPRIPARARLELEACALTAHQALGCRGVSRSDLIWGEGGYVLLELNTLPGMTPTSLVPKVAEAQGISFSELVELILEAALEGPH